MTQTQERDGQAAAAAGGRSEPGWSFITTGENTSDGVGTTVGAGGTQPSAAKGQANEHGNNTDQDEDGGASGSGTTNTTDAFAEPEATAKHRRIAETPEDARLPR